MAPSARFIFTRMISTLTDKATMTTTTNNIQLPYLEATVLDGKQLQTSIEWTERLWHYIKRIYDIDIKQSLSAEAVPTRTR